MKFSVARDCPVHWYLARLFCVVYLTRSLATDTSRKHFHTHFLLIKLISLEFPQRITERVTEAHQVLPSGDKTTTGERNNNSGCLSLLPVPGLALPIYHPTRFLKLQSLAYCLYCYLLMRIFKSAHFFLLKENLIYFSIIKKFVSSGSYSESKFVCT